jgi:hypothetical protein
MENLNKNKTKNYSKFKQTKFFISNIFLLKLLFSSVYILYGKTLTTPFLPTIISSPKRKKLICILGLCMCTYGENAVAPWIALEDVVRERVDGEVVIWLVEE